MNPQKFNRVGVVSYVVRKSMFFPITSILIWQVVILFLMLSIRPIVEFINQAFSQSWSLEDIRVWWILILQLINIGIIFYFVLGWLYTFYIVRPHEVIFRKGLLLEERLDYRFDNILKVDVKQNFLGKMFDFGTIKVFTTGIKEDAVFYDVPQPHKYANAIAKSIIPRSMIGLKTS